MLPTVSPGDVLSGKRIALTGLPPGGATRLRDVIEDRQAFCRVTSGGSQESYDAMVLCLGEPGQMETLSCWTAPCVVLGSLADLHECRAALSGPNRQFMAMPGSDEELLFRLSLALQSAPAKPPAAKPTVVLADDDPSITALLGATLSRQGIDCRIAADGGRAMALARESQAGVMILDVNMPNRNGFEILAELRQDAAFRGMRVLMLTGCEQEADILRGFGLGADDYVIKPFNPMEVAARVKRLLGQG
jgi:CheY-like chemotaxis protein